jgi:hypothetical protein
VLEDPSLDDGERVGALALSAGRGPEQRERVRVVARTVAAPRLRSRSRGRRGVDQYAEGARVGRGRGAAPARRLEVIVTRSSFVLLGHRAPPRFGDVAAAFAPQVPTTRLDVAEASALRNAMRLIKGGLYQARTSRSPTSARCSRT